MNVNKSINYIITYGHTVTVLKTDTCKDWMSIHPHRYLLDISLFFKLTKVNFFNKVFVTNSLTFSSNKDKRDEKNKEMHNEKPVKKTIQCLF